MAKMDVVVIDDSKVILELMEIRLNELKANFDISYRLFDNPLVALNEIDNEQPNIVICDYNMPQLEGPDVIAAIKRKYPKIRCILLTTSDSANSFKIAKLNGADNYLIKPPDMLQLKSIFRIVQLKMENT